MPRIAWLEPTIVVGLLVGVGSLAVVLQAPPPALPATAPAEMFSAERAMAHVRQIAREPHPTGSPRAVEVREYLVEELHRLGLKTTILTDDEIPGETIVGLKEGENPRGKAIMIAAHHDSVARGPGAGDDAAGVAAILETVRALNAGPRLANDLIVVITDGEEQGLWGSSVFIKHHEWVDRVGIVLNFEARGSSGPSFMFETSTRNGWMIRQLAHAATHPMATSLAYAVYQRMPNNTDLTNFKRAGLKGLNFAFVEGVENYHQPTDTPENLDARSLQHHGSYALSLARRFGEIDLNPAASEPDAIYFPVMGPHLVVYAGAWVWPLTVAASLGFLGVVGLGLRRRQVTANGLVAGVLVGLAILLVGVLAALGAWMLIAPWRVPVPGKNYRGSAAIAWGLGGLGLVASLAVLAVAMRKVRGGHLAIGGLFWWLVLLVATSAWLPGGTYLFLWPLVFGLAAQVVSLARPGVAFPAASVGSLAAMALLPPTFQTLCTALGPSQPYAASPVAGLVVLALIPVLAGFNRDAVDHSTIL